MFVTCRRVAGREQQQQGGARQDDRETRRAEVGMQMLGRPMPCTTKSMVVGVGTVIPEKYSQEYSQST